MNYGLLVKLPNFYNCSKKLHMQGYMMGHGAGLPTHVAMKYGRSNMANNGKNSVLWNFSHELWVIGRSCQNSATAVRNYICRATRWAIVPVYPSMLQ